MQDRVSVNPGRVLITPENGAAAYYATMTRADNPTQEGTPLNKSSLLKDATATLFGLGVDAVPDDVLGLLSRLHKGLGNEYVWVKGIWEEKLTAWTGSFLQGAATHTVLWSEEIEFSEIGVPSLKNPTTITYKVQGGDPLFFRGKYVRQTTSQFNTGIYKVTESATFTTSGKTVLLFNSGSYEVTGATLKTDGYVNSPDPNAYPIDDGYTYRALGRFGDKMRIEMFSYAGTGVAGSGNPSTITFSDTPKMWGIFRYTDEIGVSYYCDARFSPATVTSDFLQAQIAVGASAQGNWLIKKSGNTYLWYERNSDANAQLNATGRTYYGFAIY